MTVGAAERGLRGAAGLLPRPGAQFPRRAVDAWAASTRPRLGGQVRNPTMLNARIQST